MTDPIGTPTAEELRERLASAQASLASATVAYKKLRRMRGADAHKRAWYYEEQMHKYQALVDRLDTQLQGQEAS